MIFVNSLEIYRKKKKIISNITFEVPEYSVFGIIGANGIGKTTLLKAISGFIGIDKGCIKLPNERFTRSDRIGSFINSDCFDRQLTGYENLYLLLSYKGISDVSQLLNKKWPLDMEEYKHVKVKKYSQGTVQKLGIIAATISPSYSLIVLDEPHNSLDPKSIVQLRKYIEFLNHRGATLIISSHTISELIQTCDEILFMKEKDKVKQIPKEDFSTIEKIIESK